MELSEEIQGFANAYKAFSPALNGDALSGLDDQELSAEQSINMEAGVRGSAGDLDYEATLFRMDFDNQIIPANSNSQFQVTNGGKTLHQGVELGVGTRLFGGFSIDANLTYIADARFVGDRFSRAGALTTPDDNRVPYTPEWIANLGLSYDRGPVRSALRIHHTSSQFTDVLNTRAINENLSGFYGQDRQLHDCRRECAVPTQRSSRVECRCEEFGGRALYCEPSAGHLCWPRTQL